MAKASSRSSGSTLFTVGPARYACLNPGLRSDYRKAAAERARTRSGTRRRQRPLGLERAVGGEALDAGVARVGHQQAAGVGVDGHALGTRKAGQDAQQVAVGGREFD